MNVLTDCPEGSGFAESKHIKCDCGFLWVLKGKESYAVIGSNICINQFSDYRHFQTSHRAVVQTLWTVSRRAFESAKSGAQGPSQRRDTVSPGFRDRCAEEVVPAGFSEEEQEFQ